MIFEVMTPFYEIAIPGAMAASAQMWMGEALTILALTIAFRCSYGCWEFVHLLIPYSLASPWRLRLLPQSEWGS
jgi:hypothetical protein